MITLQKRLQTVADLTVGDKVCIDVGTDHAYLPAYLVMSGKCPSAIASDIREKPLENAKKTLEKYGLTDKIELRLCPGLDGFSADDGDEIIIAGMGGEIIADIITACPFLKSGEKHLILQPMSRAEDTRKALCEGGFSIDREEVVTDLGRDYVVISAYYKADFSKKDAPGYFLLGETGYKTDEISKRINARQTDRIKNRIEGLTGCGRNPGELAYLQKTIENIKELGYENS